MLTTQCVHLSQLAAGCFAANSLCAKHSYLQNDFVLLLQFELPSLHHQYHEDSRRARVVDHLCKNCSGLGLVTRSKSSWWSIWWDETEHMKNYRHRSRSRSSPLIGKAATRHITPARITRHRHYRLENLIVNLPLRSLTVSSNP